MYYGARYYDPAGGRFISTDPVTPGGGLNPQGFNRHAYVMNNPLRYVDPDGRELQVAPGHSRQVLTDLQRGLPPKERELVSLKYVKDGFFRVTLAKAENPSWQFIKLREVIESKRVTIVHAVENWTRIQHTVPGIGSRAPTTLKKEEADGMAYGSSSPSLEHDIHIYYDRALFPSDRSATLYHELGHVLWGPHDAGIGQTNKFIRLLERTAWNNVAKYYPDEPLP
jgi:hypothetical protein